MVHEAGEVDMRVEEGAWGDGSKLGFQLQVGLGIVAT